MFNVNPKTVAGVLGTDENELAYVLERAIELQEALYEFNGSPRPIEHRGLGRVNRCLFRLRKALEGIWGHDLPESPLVVSSFFVCKRSSGVKT